MHEFCLKFQKELQGYLIKKEPKSAYVLKRAYETVVHFKQSRVQWNDLFITLILLTNQITRSFITNITKINIFDKHPTKIENKMTAVLKYLIIYPEFLGSLLRLSINQNKMWDILNSRYFIVFNINHKLVLRSH